MQIGAYEAKTHLPQLLERAAKGERITITKHGVPVAVLGPVSSDSRQPTAQTACALREFRNGRTLGDLILGDLIKEARR